MITAIEHREYERKHVDDWDRLLQHVFDEETRRLLLLCGVASIARELDKGPAGMYQVQKCNIQYDGKRRDIVTGEVVVESKK